MTDKTINGRVHLGDDIYAEYDGCGIALKNGNCKMDCFKFDIYLNENVLLTLIKFYELQLIEDEIFQEINLND